jgi:hypothetical protein
MRAPELGRWGATRASNRRCRGVRRASDSRYELRCRCSVVPPAFLRRGRRLAGRRRRRARVLPGLRHGGDAAPGVSRRTSALWRLSDDGSDTCLGRQRASRPCLSRPRSLLAGVVLETWATVAPDGPTDQPAIARGSRTRHHMVPELGIGEPTALRRIPVDPANESDGAIRLRECNANVAHELSRRDEEHDLRELRIDRHRRPRQNTLLHRVEACSFRTKPAWPLAARACAWIRRRVCRVDGARGSLIFGWGVTARGNSHSPSTKVGRVVQLGGRRSPTAGRLPCAPG